MIEGHRHGQGLLCSALKHLSLDIQYFSEVLRLGPFPRDDTSALDHHRVSVQSTGQDLAAGALGSLGSVINSGTPPYFGAPTPGPASSMKAVLDKLESMNDAMTGIWS